MDFPKEFFKPGDDIWKFINHKLLNWLLQEVTKNISVGPGLTLSSNAFGTVIGLAKKITSFRIVELTSTLGAYDSADAAFLRYTENDGITRDDNLSITVYDLFGNTGVIGTRGVAFEVEFSDKKRWAFVPLGRSEDSSSSSGCDDKWNKARFIQFKLDGDLAVTDEFGEAIVDSFFDGNDPGTNITVRNMPSSAGNNVFSGSNGAYGKAIWNEVDCVYEIWQLECP